MMNKYTLRFQNIKIQKNIYKAKSQITIFILEEEIIKFPKGKTFYINKWEVHNEDVIIMSI